MAYSTKAPRLRWGGSYTLLWNIETDADNPIRITTSNHASISPAPDEIIIHAGQAEGSVQFYSLDEIYDLQIQIDYQAGSYIRVNRIDLIGPANADRLFTLTFILSALSLLCFLWASGRLTPSLRGELIILAAAVLIASIPSLKSSLHTGHDSEFHMGRLLNLVQGLRSGQFPVRVAAYLQNGYGAVTSVYYPDLFLYFPACMILAGASFVYSYRVFFIALHLLSALSMRYAAGKLFNSRKAGLAASVLYTLSQYRLMDIYTRYAVGESLTMCFLPLFALGLYEVLFRDKKRWKLLAVSAAALCYSHLISTAICGCIAVGLGLFSCVHIVRTRRMGSITKASATALLLSLCFLIPLFTYSRQNIETAWMQRDLTAEARSPAQLLLHADNLDEVSDSSLSTYAVGLGTPILLAAFAALYAALSKNVFHQEDRLALFLCLFGFIFSLMSTTLFPWSRVVTLTHGLAAYIQFPWRMLLFATLCFAFAGGYAMKCLAGEKHGAAQLALLALCVVCILPLLSDETRKENVLQANRLPYWDQRFGDYTLPGANLRALSVTEPIADAGIAVEGYYKYGCSIDADISVDQGGSVVFPLYAFDGYTASLDGVPLTIGHNANHHLMLSFDTGAQGHLSIRFEGKSIWLVGDVISLLTLLWLVLNLLHHRKYDPTISLDHGKAV